MGTRRWLARAGVVAAAAVVAATGLAGMAHADDRLLDTDKVKITRLGSTSAKAPTTMSS